MKMNKIQMLILLGVLFTYMRDAGALRKDDNPYQCTCASSHPQQLFCDSHFALRGVVITELPRVIYGEAFIGGKTVTRKIAKEYELMIQRVFRGKEAILGIPRVADMEYKESMKWDSVNITTPYAEEACGIELEHGVQYLIFGTRNDYDQLETKLCNFFSEWDEVEDQTKRGILGDYDCRCRVETGITLMEEQPDYKVNKNNTCVYNISPTDLVDECAMNFLTCRKLVTPINAYGQAEQCVWVEGKEFGECRIPVV